MNILKKPETYIGVAGLALVTALANCPGKIEIREPEVRTEISDKRTITRTGVEEVFRSLDEEKSELTVHVPIDEDGEIPENFNYLGAVRDCVESTGIYRCTDDPRSKFTTCYSGDEDKPVTPINIGRRSWVTGREKEDVVHVGYIVFGRYKEGESFNLEELKDPEHVKSELNNACQTSLNLLDQNTSFEEICDKECTPADVIEREEMMYLIPNLDDLGSNLFEEAKEAGLEVEDKGGNTTVITLPEWNTISHTKMEYIYDEEEQTYMYMPAIIIEKPSGWHKVFYSPEEAVNYLLEVNPQEKEE